MPVTPIEGPVGEDDLFAYLEGSADAETMARIARERQVLGSYVSNWLGKLSTASDDLFDVDWNELFEKGQ